MDRIETAWRGLPEDVRLAVETLADVAWPEDGDFDELDHLVTFLREAGCH